MKPLQSPALGLTWLSDSLRTLRLQPVAYTGIVVFSLLVSGLLSSLPFIGTLLAGLWMPYASVLTGLAARDTLAGRVPSYLTLAAILRDGASRQPLLLLGLISSLGMQLVELLGRDAVSRWQTVGPNIDLASVTGNIPWASVGGALLVYVPLLMMTLFAPLLIVEKRQGVLKSLFYSFFGVLRSIIPVMVWLLGMGLASGLLLFAFEGAFIALGAPRLLVFIAPLVIALVSAACQAGIWSMFRDIFAGNAPDGRMPRDLEGSRR